MNRFVKSFANRVFLSLLLGALIPTTALGAEDLPKDAIVAFPIKGKEDIYRLEWVPQDYTCLDPEELRAYSLCAFELGKCNASIAQLKLKGVGSKEHRAPEPSWVWVGGALALGLFIGGTAVLYKYHE